MFTLEELTSSGFKLSVIADITCDMNGSIPTTLRSSSIQNPFYGYHTRNLSEDLPFKKESICIMAVDNLPCELPRDSSDDFGKDLMERVLPFLFLEDPDRIIERASICKDGQLNMSFKYLEDYAY